MARHRLEVVHPHHLRNRPRSPVTVEEWVATLPEGEEEQGEERRTPHQGAGEVEDTLCLGAEAVGVEGGRGVGRDYGRADGGEERVSRTSAHSLASSCSRESILQAREPDPEQVGGVGREDTLHWTCTHN